MRFGVIGIVFENSLELGDRFINASFLGQSNPQIGPRHWVFGGDVESNLELIDRFVQAAMVKQELPQSVVRDKVLRGHGDGVPPQRLAVAPVGRLHMGAPCQGDDRGGGGHRKNSSLNR